MTTSKLFGDLTPENVDRIAAYWKEKTRELYAAMGKEPPPEPTPEELVQERQEAAVLDRLRDNALVVRWLNRETTDEDRARLLHAMTDEEWTAHYSARAPAPLSAAARVALADAAPGAFLRDTGREPPSDLVARVFAALAP